MVVVPTSEVTHQVRARVQAGQHTHPLGSRMMLRALVRPPCPDKF